MRNGVFVTFFAAMLLVAFAPRPHARPGALRVQTAWLAERESAVGDWEAVRAPLRAGDELQLTVRSDEDANVYVISESEGRRAVIFPRDDVSPRVRAGWSYALPGPHRTWRLDGAEHDRFYLVAARRPLGDPLAALASPDSTIAGAPDLPLPLRDGRPGAAAARVATAPEIVVDAFDAR
jgi:hypothetical protein